MASVPAAWIPGIHNNPYTKLDELNRPYNFNMSSEDPKWSALDSADQMLSSLRAAKCPTVGKRSGEDIEWIADGEHGDGAHCLARVAAALGSGHKDDRDFVTDAQSAAWNRLQREQPDEIMHGQPLREAAKVCIYCSK